MGISRYSVIFSLLVAIFAISVSTVSAQVVEVSVSTDKAVYYEGEPIQIFVTAYNPNPYPVTLNFTTSCQGDYTIDGLSVPRGCRRVLTSVDIPPYDSYTWNFVHTKELFPVPVGTHAVIGVVDSVEFYGLSEPVTIAVTSNGWSCTASNETGTDQYNCTTHLDQGWNLVSIPLKQDDWSIPSVLASIDGNYSVVYAFINGVWEKATAARNPLTDMSLEYGYWIYMTAPDTLEVNGTVPPTTTINVSAGLNLLGYPSLAVQNITTVLAQVNYSVVYAYVGGAWEKSTATRSPLTEMTSGYGYWIYANEAGSYEVS